MNEFEKKEKRGGKREGAGRKATGIKRTSFCVSVTPEELEFIKNKATELKITTSKLVIEAVKKY